MIKMRTKDNKKRKTAYAFVKMVIILIMVSSWLYSIPAHAASIESGPWLQAVTDNSVVVMWESSVKKSGKVLYGTSSSSLTNSKTAQYMDVPPRDSTDIRVILQEAKITGLTANKTYYYKVITEKASSSIYSFTTHNRTGHFKFAANTHINSLTSSKNKAAWNIIKAHKPDFMILSGDIAANAKNNEYQKLMIRGAKELATIPFYTGTGNHDTRVNSRYANWFHNETSGHYPDETYYVMRIGNIRFIFLRDSSATGGKSLPESEFPKQWFKNIMSKPTSADWTMLVHNGNLYQGGKPKNGFKSWFEKLIKPYLKDIDASVAAGGSNGKMPNGIWAMESGDDWVNLVDVKGTRITVRKVRGTINNVVSTMTMTTNPGTVEPVEPQLAAPVNFRSSRVR